MNADKFWEKNLILHMISGSRAYGLARADSDEDTRGVCIPPKEYLIGLKRFEQYENETHDHTIFALDKFIRLALAANPNIIEMLYTDSKFILFINPLGERLLQAREIFLSRRVGESFSRYAISQLHRLENHHRWLIHPPEHKPRPQDFGGQIHGGRYRFAHTDAERDYQAAFKHWNHYQAWRKNRNPARADLEARYGYDTKHAMHLFRLLKMGEEILRTGKVNVLRPDADWLQQVRNGALTYEEIIRLAAEHEANLTALFEHSGLPPEPDTSAAEKLLIELQETFLFP